MELGKRLFLNCSDAKRRIYLDDYNVLDTIYSGLIDLLRLRWNIFSLKNKKSSDKEKFEKLIYSKIKTIKI